MVEGRIDLAQVDTAPGANGPLAPPIGWQGSQRDYWQLISERFRLDPGSRQQITVLALQLGNPHGMPVEITGTYRAVALEILKRVKQRHG